jgi:acyl carrier protein
VVLHVEAGPAVASAVEEIDAPATPLGIEDLRRRLQSNRPAALFVRGVPNTRTLADELAAGAILDGETRGRTAEELRSDIVRQSADSGIDPAELWALEASLPYRVDVSWATPAEDGRFDVLFTRDDLPTQKIPMPRIQPQEWSRYANHPLQAKMTRQMAPKLRDSLEQSLPSYMVPSAFVMLESLPLTPNGKVDRRALPRPEWFLTQRRGAYVGAKTPSQATICKIWSELLGVDQIGIMDDFFDLGGHSLLATQVLSRVRDAFGVDLQLRELFDMPTVVQLAEHIDGLKWATQGQPSTSVAEAGSREEGSL